jgi:hypothetical protein
MKKNYGKWMFLMLLISGIFLTSCEKGRGFGPEKRQKDLKKGKIVTVYTGTTDSEITPLTPSECDLIAGKHIYTGQVLYSNDEENMYVEYITTDGWGLNELHLYVGSFDGLPTNKPGVPIPGHFPYKKGHLGGLTSYTFTIPLTELDANSNGCYTVVAHAVVYKSENSCKCNKRETAWAKCEFKPMITLKTWIKKADGNTFWAVSDGESFTDAGWCRIMGTNVFEGSEATYNLLSYSYTDPGMISVTRMENTIKVEVKAVEGLELYKTYLYMGSEKGFDNYFDPDYSADCPKYWTFPYQIVNDYAMSHVFEIPYTESISFKDALGIRRWGWLSSYCPQ